LKEISNIIHLLSQQEINEFKKIQQQKNKIRSNKNLELFNLLASGKSTSAILDKIYSTPNPNAFYALKKRLQDNLTDFIAQKGFEQENSVEQELLKGLLAARIFFENNLTNLGFKLLWKIEKKAIDFELYSILNEIYLSALQHIHLSSTANFEKVSLKAQQNFKKVEMEFRLSLAYAKIENNLAKTTDIDGLIKSAFQEHQIEISKDLSYKSLSKLFHIFHIKGKYEINYFTISNYLISLYQEIENKEKLNQKHLFYRLEVLIIMSYSAFRKRDFEESFEYLKKIKSILEMNNHKFQEQFQEDLILLEAYYLNFTNQASAAIDVLENYKDQSFFKDLFLITCYLQQGRKKEAYKKLLQLNKSDHFYEKKYGWIWVIKKNMIELILLIELDKLEVFSSRIHSFKRKIFPKFTTTSNNNIVLFIKAIEYYDKGELEKVAKKIEQIKDNSSPHEDVFNLCFYAWLVTKMEKSNLLYENTLHLIKN
tara:strand:- start:7579 stop:9024 length:1446 start_codon:yes stop_codon:yes gene_type:complete